MSLRFRVLGSGSGGNATLVEGGSSRVLLDAGLGPRQLAQGERHPPYPFHDPRCGAVRETG
mgnify:CR=1 FL=1